ncbi:hypothetical protein F4780DRAFT_558182 [Xylariomycetidae sp. FL0641]|nr:hypothetical protein F4780DRAFT_558182 [Xylariomycetidae sp. FL0641]
MSANRNTESMAAQAGTEFSNRVPPSEPLTTKGHKPGVMVGNEAVPEFHAETHPPGTAPREDTYQPNPETEFSAQANNTQTDASATLGGATSADVHTGLGKPMQGQTSQELHGHPHKKERAGLEGTGASAGVDSVRQKGADLPEGVSKGMRGKADPDYPGAEDRVPAGAEEVASERKVPERAYDYTQSGKPK